EGQDIAVWIHSNLDAVELFVNGKSAGRKTVVKDRHLEWTVPYAPGEISAYGYKAEKVVMKAQRKTAGPVATVNLTSDRSTLAGDGRDIVLLRAEAVDKAGIAVPRADNLVHFDVEGPGRIIGVGNGNPTSLEPDRATSRRLFNGLAQAILQSDRGARSQITVTARSDGLPPRKATIRLLTDQ
ncbi:MAG: DUF4982 domain-containing protein, partial [Asticcacaulis sp.]|nr:DUF4982 domain-containing protein [Asticcacaulis sp.]